MTKIERLKFLRNKLKGSNKLKNIVLCQNNNACSNCGNTRMVGVSFINTRLKNVFDIKNLTTLCIICRNVKKSESIFSRHTKNKYLKMKNKCQCKKCAFGYPVPHYCPRDYAYHPCVNCKSYPHLRGT